MKPLTLIAGRGPKVVRKPELGRFQRQGTMSFDKALSRLESYRGVAGLEGRQHIPSGV